MRLKNVFAIGILAVAVLLTAWSLPNTQTVSAEVFTENYVAETRCGWFVNPTPANAWLNDAAGQWIIGVQGGFQADGAWPEFDSDQWVNTNVNYGYGCACMNVTTDRKAKRITRIVSSRARPLSVCRKDKAISKREPK